MNLPLKLVCVLISLACFALAALGVPSGRFGLVAAGLGLWEASTVA